jgi:hypothetical protein
VNPALSHSFRERFTFLDGSRSASTKNDLALRIAAQNGSSDHPARLCRRNDAAFAP